MGPYWTIHLGTGVMKRLRTPDLGERHGLFSCYGRVKANSATQEPNVTNINTKAGPPNRQIGLPLNSLFL